MKHIHGIEIRLLDDKGRLVAEGTPAKRTESSLLRFNGQVGSRNVCLKPGKRFKICVTIHRNFKFYAAEGVKIVIVADGTYAGDPNGRVRQRYGLWWIDENEHRKEFVIEGFTVWNERRASREECTDFFVPEVDNDQENATTNWLTQEHYCANEGCIAVFVERGRLVEEDEEAGVSLGDRSNMPSPIPIRYDEFLSLNSNNAFPYVFEFRNSNAAGFSASKSDTFGGIDRTRDTSDSEIVYDTDYETDTDSEDEAEATDKSGSESTSQSEPESEIDSDTESLISVDSYDSAPRSGSRKRKARASANKPRRKRAKTNAEKNAEADAGNATFASSMNRKNREADATNATFMSRADADRDDEEERPLDVPWLKREPGIKQERSESTVPQKSSVKGVASRKGVGIHKMSGRSIVDLTLDDTDDEDGDDVSNGIGHLWKKLDDMTKNMESLGRKRGLK